MFFRNHAAHYTQAAPERGAVAAEYSVLMALIVLAMLGVIQGLTGGITNTLQAIIDVLP